MKTFVLTCVDKDTHENAFPLNLKGIVRPFDLKDIYLFYYLIDAGEFSYSNDMH